MVNNLPALQETQVQSLGQEDPLEKEIPTSVFLPGESHGKRSLVGYSSRGYKRVRHDLATKQHQYCIAHVHHIFFIHLSVTGHLGCFRVLAIVSSAVKNSGVHVSFLIMVFS